MDPPCARDKGKDKQRDDSKDENYNMSVCITCHVCSFPIMSFET